MTKEQREQLEAELNFLDKRMDRAEDKMHKADEEGNKERAAHYDHVWEVHWAKLSGYIEALHILGYSAVQNESTGWKYMILNN